MFGPVVKQFSSRGLSGCGRRTFCHDGNSVLSQARINIRQPGAFWGRNGPVKRFLEARNDEDLQVRWDQRSSEVAALHFPGFPVTNF